MAYITSEIEIIGTPVEQPLSFRQFAELDHHQLWTLFEELRARVEYFEREDRRKAKEIDVLWKTFTGKGKPQK